MDDIAEITLPNGALLEVSTIGKSEAWLNGWLAHSKHYPSSQNPYSRNLQSRSYYEWSVGWETRRQAEIKKQPLTYDR